MSKFSILKSRLVTWVIFLALLPYSAYSAQPSCFDIFLNSDFPLIAMNPKYRGENSGHYVNSITGEPWGVVYFDHEQKVKYQVFVQDGLLVDRNGNKINTPVDTENLFSESGLFIVDRDYYLYLLPFHQRGKYHHSSLSGGGPVRFAGTIAVMNGVLRELSNQSGHYKPTAPQTLKVLKWFLTQGIRLDQANLTGDVAYYYSKTFKMTPSEFLPLLEK
jgi:hypothetical protein